MADQMTDHDFPDIPALNSAVRRNVQAQEIWLLQNHDSQPVCVDFAWHGGQASWLVPESWQGILLVNRVDLTVRNGELSLNPLCLEVLSKLLAFIDEALQVDGQEVESCAWMSMQQDDISVWQDRKRAESWFLTQVLNPSLEFRALLNWLRHSESYWLVRFLLQQSETCCSLQDLGQRYGVSYSHFRRLCRQALGTAAKTELRDWRMARSLLDVFEGDKSLTQVALKHGYASSSHFSNEIKERFGVSPRGLSNIIQLAAK